MIPAVWLWGGAAFVAASGYLVAGIQTVRLAREQAAHVSEVAEIRDAARESERMAQARANDAATRYEQWKAAQRPKIVTVIKEVDRALQTDSRWASEPIPVSVRDAIDAARALDATTKP